MSKLWILPVIGILAVLLGSTAQANEDWVINEFASDISIQENGQVLVEELIDVDFGSLNKHGILRDTPEVYSNAEGSKLYTKLEVVEVTQDARSAPYELIRNEANLRIKIGDPDRTINGQHVYTITYTATGVLAGFNTFDELYWNVTGHDWPVPIESASATVTLPRDGIVQTNCYVGAEGSTTACDTLRAEGQFASFTASSPLAPGEGLTIAVGYNKGLVPILTVAPPPSPIDLFTSPATLISFVLVSAAGLFIVVRHWWLHGRDRWWLRKSLHDPNKRSRIRPLREYEPITAEYDPPLKLRPAEIGVLMDERADTLDVSATIVDLAVRGYLTIEEKKKKWRFGSSDYEFTKSNKLVADLLGYESMLLNKLFDGKGKVKLSKLKNKFNKDLAEVKKELYREIIRKKLFASNPQTVRLKYAGIAVGIGALGIAVTVGGFIWQNPLLVGVGLGLDLIGVVAIAVSFAMPRRTAHGRELYRLSRGYKLFVSGTEKYRQPFFERENIFMEVLPYAIVFGVTEKLAKAFQELGIEPKQPSWYTGTAPFNAAVFASSVNNFSASLSSVMASSPSSGASGSSGGFSGGGFGGGGGGSW